MFAYQDDKNFFALIGKDNDSLYDAEGNLLCGMFFPFLDAPSNEGIDYTIICDPWDERLDDYIAEVWLTWLPLSDQYDAGQLLSELA